MWKSWTFAFNISTGNFRSDLHILQNRLDYCIHFKSSLLFLTMMLELFLISVSSLVKEYIVQTMEKHKTKILNAILSNN